jgi:hypothetical protein
MHSILGMFYGAKNDRFIYLLYAGKVQHQARGWVGLSVVHLGDRDVPNSLMFIDKYHSCSNVTYYSPPF